MSNDSRADYGTDRLPGQRFPLPSERDCYDCANRCLDMWNDSVDQAHGPSCCEWRMRGCNWLLNQTELNSHTVAMPTGRPWSPRTDPSRGCPGTLVQDH